MPGVRSVALATSLPTVAPASPRSPSRPKASPFRPARTAPSSCPRRSDACLFRHARRPPRAGRGFRTTDRADAPWVAVVDETFAARYLGPNPLGQRLRLVELGGRTAEVVGISRPAATTPIIMPPQPFIFLPLAQHPASRLTLIAHTDGDAAAMAGPLRGVVQADRRRRARLSRGDHPGAVRRTVEKAGQPADRHLVVGRTGGPDDGAHRPLRHRGVSGEPAHAGDRHSHGARRRRRGRCCAWSLRQAA